MDRGAWRATVHGVTRVGHDLATEPPPCLLLSLWGFIPLPSLSAAAGAVVFSFLSAVSTLALKPRNPG